MKIVGIGPSRKRKMYTTVSAASRELSGNGTESRRTQITRKARTGGFVGTVWVQDVTLRITTRRR